MRPTITAQRICEMSHGLVVRRRYEWGARRAYTDENPVTYPADNLFLHISVTNPSAYSSEDRHAQAIEGIGISRFPNTGISYNMGVMPSGRIYEFQPVGRRGAHTVNDKKLVRCTTSGCPGRGVAFNRADYNLNYNSRAVVICQNTNNTVSSAQIHSIAKVGATWKRCGYVKRTAKWNGHRCVSAKSCPGNEAWEEMTELDRLTEFYYLNGLTNKEEDIMADLTAADKDWFNAAVSNRLTEYHNDKAIPTLDRVRNEVIAGANINVETLADAIVARLSGGADAATIRAVVREELANLTLSLG
jgi:hypothetical protein